MIAFVISFQTGKSSNFLQVKHLYIKKKHYSKTQASSSTPTAPMYSNCMAMKASSDSSSITFTRTIKCIIFDPILSCEGHIIRGLRNAWQSCWSSQQTCMLLHDLQNVKMSFCPIAFVLGDDHISEVQYEKKSRHLTGKRIIKLSWIVLGVQRLMFAN